MPFENKNVIKMMNFICKRLNLVNLKIITIDIASSAYKPSKSYSPNFLTIYRPSVDVLR